jgi:MFS family permease
VWVLSSISLVVAIGFGVVVPVLPVFAASFGANPLAAGAVVSAFAVMRFVTAPLVGRADDRFGHRAVLMTGLIVVGVSSALTGTAQNYVQLIVLRGMGGLGSAMFSVSGMTVLLASVEATHRGRAAGLYQGGFLVGAMAGPAVGGLLAGISLRAPFYFYAGVLGIAALCALGLTSVAATTTGARASAVPLRDVAQDPRFRAACLSAFTTGWNANGTRMTLVPLFVAAFLADDVVHAALITGVAMAVAAGVQTALVLPAGALVDRIGRRGPMIVGALVLAVALVATPWSPGTVALTACLCLYAAGSALIGTAPAAAVGDTGGGDRAIAVFTMSGDLGSILGPLAVGALAGTVGYRPAFALGAVLWLATAAAAARMPRPTAPREAPDRG